LDLVKKGTGVGSSKGMTVFDILEILTTMLSSPSQPHQYHSYVCRKAVSPLSNVPFVVDHDVLTPWPWILKLQGDRLGGVAMMPPPRRGDRAVREHGLGLSYPAARLRSH
jgi:hypothetical protein